MKPLRVIRVAVVVTVLLLGSGCSSKTPAGIGPVTAATMSTSSALETPPPVVSPTMSSGTTPTSPPPALTSTTPQTPAKQPPPSTTTPANGLAGQRIYVDPNSDAARQAQQWRQSRPADAALMEKVARGGSAYWTGDWQSSAQVTQDVRAYVAKARAANATPVIVAYNITNRDCGSYSGGGANSDEAYRDWMRSLASGIGSTRAMVIVEPDAIADWDCLSQGQQSARANLIKDAVGVLTSTSGAWVYIDIGTARWLEPVEAARRLRLTGIEQARGFSLNVSNFIGTSESITYGDKLSALVGNKRYVIDTSRNGLGPDPDGEWCNPSGRALGQLPTTSTASARADAYLWVKIPGTSDGSCNGAPEAGTWWPDYALGLAQRATW